MPVPPCFEHLPDYLINVLEIPLWVRRKLIIIDEVADVFTSFRSTGREVRDVLSFIRMIRKQECDLLLTTQQINRIPLGLVEQLDSAVYVDGGKGGSKIRAENRIYLHIYDLTTGSRRSRLSPTGPDFDNREFLPDKSIVLRDVQSCFGEYDTKQLITASWARGFERNAAALLGAYQPQWAD